MFPLSLGLTLHHMVVLLCFGYGPYVTNARLKFTAILPQLSESWDYRRVPLGF